MTSPSDTQALLQPLRKAHVRVINITSVGAHIAIPFGRFINASKSAFADFSDTLRLELHPFGIHVSAVEPGAIKTPAVDKTLGMSKQPFVVCQKTMRRSIARC